MIDLFEIYDEYILDKRDENYEKRYEGNDDWLHASGAGMCVRKHYYAYVEKLPAPDKDANTMRLFRLGDLVHTDMQSALQLYADENNLEVYIETEITIPRLKVRSFIDALIVKDGALYDIKTCNQYKWQSLFSKHGSLDNARNYMVQLGTYGLYFRDNGMDIKKMSLLFYNKNDSRVKEVKVSRTYIDTAERYWKKVEELFKDGLPPIQPGLAPVIDWECSKKYCSYFKPCGGGLKGLK